MSQRKRVSPSDIYVHSALTPRTGYFSPRIHARMHSHASRMTAAALVKKEPDPGEVVRLLARKRFQFRCDSIGSGASSGSGAAHSRGADEWKSMDRDERERRVRSSLEAYVAVLKA